jgi:hypothetical protein
LCSRPPIQSYCGLFNARKFSSLEVFLKVRKQAVSLKRPEQGVSELKREDLLISGA